MAEAAAHNKEMENLVGTEVPVPGIENRQLQGVNDAAQGLDVASCQQPYKSFPWKGSEDL